MKGRGKSMIRNKEKSVESEMTKKNGKKVAFSFHAPWAKEVFLAGEFNQWDVRSMPMKRGKDGNWRVNASLIPGRYEYKFLADNHWIEDLPGVELAANSFGTQNLILRVE
jgi:1,4-alpha-glucan branching enzyme